MDVAIPQGSVLWRAVVGSEGMVPCHRGETGQPPAASLPLHAAGMVPMVVAVLIAYTFTFSSFTKVSQGQRTEKGDNDSRRNMVSNNHRGTTEAVSREGTSGGVMV